MYTSQRVLLKGHFVKLGFFTKRILHIIESYTNIDVFHIKVVLICTVKNIYIYMIHKEN